MAYHYKGGKVNEVKSYKIVTETGKVLEYTRTKAAALELIKPLQKIYGKNLRIEKIEWNVKFAFTTWERKTDNSLNILKGKGFVKCVLIDRKKRKNHRG